MSRFLKKGDIIILLCVLGLCALLFVPRLFFGDDLVATVYEDGHVIHEIELSKVSESYEIRISGGVLLVEHNSISYKNADCKDKTCEKFGKLTKAGDTASCVPNKTVVTLSGKRRNKKIDAFTY